MTDFEAMTREQLVDEMKRLRREESDIRAEGGRMIADAVRATMRDLETVRCLLQFRSIDVVRVRGHGC